MVGFLKFFGKIVGFREERWFFRLGVLVVGIRRRYRIWKVRLDR